jgi:thermitase
MSMQQYKHPSHRFLIATLALAVVVFVSPTGHSGSQTKQPSSPAPKVQTTPANLAEVTPVASLITSAKSTTLASVTTSADVAMEQKYGLPTYSHPQYTYHALMSAPTGTLYTDDAAFLNRISAPGAWTKFSNTNAAPVIAVIDTGFALNHQALVGRWNGTQGTSSWLGWDFIDNDNNPMAGRTYSNGTGVFHGTMTAGLAGLLNPNAKLMPLQALDDNGDGTTDTVAAAVHYAADNGANIISLSLGSSVDDSYLHQQIDYAIAKGVTVVAAAGNDGCNCLSYPANYPEVLSVGASTSTDTTATFSSYGSNLDVIAPGTASDVCSSFYTSGNATSAYSCAYSGTSFSTPITSGLVSLLIQQYPGLAPPTIISLIERSAYKTTAMGSQNFTIQQGYGRIDVAKAMGYVTIPSPQGELANKGTYSLSASSLQAGPVGDTTCVGVPGTTCSIVLTGPSSQTVNLGTQTLDAYGGAEFSWNAATLSLAVGQWTVTAFWTDNGQTTSSASPQTITISP